MRNRYSPPDSPVADAHPRSRRLRAFGICAVVGMVSAFATILAFLSALGIEITDDVVIGLGLLAVPLSLLAAALVAPFRTINIYAGAALCSFITLVGTLVLAYLASGLE